MLHRRLAAAARDLFKDLQRSAQPVPPLAFWLGLRAVFPQFNQQSNAVRRFSHPCPNLSTPLWPNLCSVKHASHPWLASIGCSGLSAVMRP